jgi:hypothetical protein
LSRPLVQLSPSLTEACELTTNPETETRMLCKNVGRDVRMDKRNWGLFVLLMKRFHKGQSTPFNVYRVAFHAQCKHTGGK